MKWVLIGVAAFFFLFYLLVKIGAAIYDPASGKRRPEEGKVGRIVLAILDWLPFIYTL